MLQQSGADRVNRRGITQDFGERLQALVLFLIDLRRVGDERQNVLLCQLRSGKLLKRASAACFFRRMNRPGGIDQPRSGSNLTPLNALVTTVPLIGSAGWLAHQPTTLVRIPAWVRIFQIALHFRDVLV